MEQLEHVTAEGIAQWGVVAAPDRLTGRAQDNKMVFDRLVREYVAEIVNRLVDNYNELVTAEEVRLEQESGRVEAELLRVAAEEARELAEAARKAAEEARAAEEADRDAAEKAREDTEALREQAETRRAAAELLRAAEEEAREAAERSRADEHTGLVAQAVRLKDETVAQAGALKEEATAQADRAAREADRAKQAAGAEFLTAVDMEDELAEHLLIGEAELMKTMPVGGALFVTDGEAPEGLVTETDLDKSWEESY